MGQIKEQNFKENFYSIFSWVNKNCQDYILVYVSQQTRTKDPSTLVLAWVGNRLV